jgi:N-methylhydantoinase B/oxoprolinase/acetone carboxylase alpha subunit
LEGIKLRRTNAPWLTSGHLNDFTVVTPIFHAGELVALFANTCHAMDIGGRTLGADAREVFEEGLYVPMLKLFDGGKPNRDLFKLIKQNVRTPELVEGDLMAAVPTSTSTSPARRPRSTAALTSRSPTAWPTPLTP